jgi:rhomboid protease GluP
MQAGPAAITVHSERQALDWSLVLVSQGIHPTIERDPETNEWRLVVDAADFQPAVHALRQYKLENRRQAWCQELPGTGLIFDWRCTIVLLLLVFLYAFEATGRGDLQSAGIMDSRAVHSGQWWRLFTAVMLHGSLAHLVANVTTGLVLLGLAMGAFGPGVGLLASFLAGVGGNLAGLLFHAENHRGLGASGMVMGALGLLAAQSLISLRHGTTPAQLAVRGIISGGLLLVLLGFSPERNTDVLAHVAGFVSGLALGAALALGPRSFPRNPWANRLAAGVWLGLVAGAWSCALGRAWRV